MDPFLKVRQAFREFRRSTWTFIEMPIDYSLEHWLNKDKNREEHQVALYAIKKDIGNALSDSVTLADFLYSRFHIGNLDRWLELENKRKWVRSYFLFWQYYNKEVNMPVDLLAITKLPIDSEKYLKKFFK